MKSSKKIDSPQVIQKLFDEALQHHQVGRVAEAEQLYKKILNLNPRHADSLNLLGIIVHQNGNLEEAARLINQAIQIRSNVPLYHGNLGNVLKAQGKFDEAIVQYKRALALNPSYAEAYYNLGTVFQNQKKLEEAAAQYRKAIVLHPSLAVAYNNLGNVLKEQEKLDEAMICFRRAIACAPNLAEAHYNLGTLLKDLNKSDEAITYYKQALALKPDYVEAHNNLGAVLNNQRDFPDALARFDNAISYKADHVEAHVNKGMTLLLTGNFTEGWKEYEWRLRLADLTQHKPVAPQWDGSDLQGKTILLVCEQGFGDSIQFIRYASMVKKRGGRVWLACPQPLSRLFESVDGIDQIFPDGIGVPAYDCHAPLLGLPRLFDTRLDTIPHTVPYLSASADQVALWASYLQPYSGLKVGLVWAGNSRLKNPDAKAIDLRRSMQLNQFAPLAAFPDVHLFSLQKGNPAEQRITPPQGLEIIDFMDRVDDFADTAALIANLDLIIGVDTSVIHLAAAMAKPVWVLSRFDSCWRWLLEREDSPWYPTLRLFRQPRVGDWPTVVEGVCTALKELPKS